jgi:imidazolonepropionase-like amidohydrolase
VINDPRLSGDFAIRGTVMMPGSVIADGTVAITGTTIAAVGPSAGIDAGASAVKVQGIVLPGFIHLHNHLSWNILPRWIPARKFSNRYESCAVWANASATIRETTRNAKDSARIVSLAAMYWASPNTIKILAGNPAHGPHTQTVRVNTPERLE